MTEVMGDEAFFSSSAERPAHIEEATQRIRGFLEKFTDKNRTVVLVTSGGTSVPLEKNTVRSVENFSTGKRGAASAEYFLRLGYVVIFLYRTGTACPFARHFQESLSNHVDFALLDGLRLREKAGLIVAQGKPEKHRAAIQALKDYNKFTKEDVLLHVSYETVTEYLYLLQAASLALAPLRQNAMLYLAAAVSDFFVPPCELAEHKIQSGLHADGLHLHLKPVPKCLTLLRDKWAPHAFTVSFKLETDPDMLLKKANGALGRYGVHLVVANLLHSRYREVQLVSPQATQTVKLEGQGVTELEALFVPAVAEAHYTLIGDSDQPYGRPPPLRPIKKAAWCEGVEWGQLAFFMLVAPALIYFSGRLQREVLKQLSAKK